MVNWFLNEIIVLTAPDLVRERVPSARSSRNGEGVRIGRYPMLGYKGTMVHVILFQNYGLKIASENGKLSNIEWKCG